MLLVDCYDLPVVAFQYQEFYNEIMADDSYQEQEYLMTVLVRIQESISMQSPLSMQENDFFLWELH